MIANESIKEAPSSNLGGGESGAIEMEQHIFRGKSLLSGEAEESALADEDLEKSLVTHPKGDATASRTSSIKQTISEDESVTALLNVNYQTDSHDRPSGYSDKQKEFMIKTLGIDEEAYVDSKNSHDDEREQVLKEDVYSIIYTAETKSQALWFAVFVFCVQQTILLLILFGLLDFSSDNNKLQLPPGVPATVTVAQALGVLLIVFTVAVFGDLTTGMARLIDGFDQEVLLSHPNVTCMKWFLSGCFQMSVGCTMTAVLFILLIQSTTVVGMCLNFAALHFVQEIDDMSFLLGQKGFITLSIQEECDRISNLTVPKGRVRVRRWARQAFVVFLTIGLFVPFFILLDRQWKGEYICRTLYIQFGDAYIPELAYFSGRYTIEQSGFVSTSTKLESRPVYFDASKQMRLAYCSKESAWVVSYANGTDHCDFYVKSSSTNTFDVVSLKDSTWFSKNYETESVVPADWFFIGCNDCGKDLTQCSSDTGSCVKGVCVCNSGRMGINCQYADPTCEKLSLDARTNPLPLEEGVNFPENYGLYLDKRSKADQNGIEEDGLVQFNFHPAYTSSLYTDKRRSAPNSTDIMFFTGRRWVIFAPRLPKDEISESDKNTTEIHVISNLVASVLDKVAQVTTGDGEQIGADFIENYRPYFFSAPIDFGTPSDTLEPIGLDWFRAAKRHDHGYVGFEPDESQPLQTNFICAQCDAITNPCYNDFQCDALLTQTCFCDRFYMGSLCEHPVRCDQSPCLNGGQCDSWHGYCQCVQPYYGNLCQYEDKAPTMAPSNPPTPVDNSTMATADNSTAISGDNSTTISVDNSTTASVDNSTITP